MLCWKHFSCDPFLFRALLVWSLPFSWISVFRGRSSTRAFKSRGGEFPPCTNEHTLVHVHNVPTFISIHIPTGLHIQAYMCNILYTPYYNYRLRCKCTFCIFEKIFLIKGKLFFEIVLILNHPRYCNSMH